MRDNNERLEFLGDALLDCIVAEKLYNMFPYKDEGFLTEMRSKIVSRDRLADLSRKMGLNKIIEYDIGLGGNKQFLATMSGNAFEAVIGAIYLDRGYKFLKKYIDNRLLNYHLNLNELVDEVASYKSKIYKWAQKNKHILELSLVSEEMLGSNKVYEVAVLINNESVVSEKNYSKKRAEELACMKACAVLEI